ncbi:MAG: DUF4397 domain-containing protein [Armatimonadetes bacterium]|nr:DUF4397 domain-containing protein [Armatimonadota bacterium]
MKLRSGIVGFALLVLAIVGCGGGSSTILPDPNYRFMNFCPDATLDLLVNDDTVNTNVGFLDDTTTFKSVKSELKDFSIEETGSTVVIDSQATTLTGNTDTLVLAYGLNNYGTENEKRLRFSFQTVNRIAPNPSKARVYAFNALNRDPGNQNFSVVFKNPGTLSNINFAAVALGGVTMQEIDAGPQTLVAQRENTETEVATVTKTFEGGKIYLMALTGTESGTGNLAPTINFIEIPSL